MLFTCQLSFALVRVSQPFFSATLASPGTYTAFPHARPTAVSFRGHATSPACFIACANSSAPGSLCRRHTEPDPIRSRQLARCCSASPHAGVGRRFRAPLPARRGRNRRREPGRFGTSHMCYADKPSVIISQDLPVIPPVEARV